MHLLGPPSPWRRFLPGGGVLDEARHLKVLHTQEVMTAGHQLTRTGQPGGNPRLLETAPEESPAATPAIK